ncbi:hypothetical protein Cantr_07011 [Candida viswanathii]|uniref:Uncharacterized protein n=1 Tax=Candida viswanathii TaxID=5486 RepID=A0A367XWJ2_9ASCO|nr:hypothetical protein Cantr_07011 [Candida viswanathii]
MEELLEANAAILHVLPNSLSGLITRVPVYDILLESVDNQYLKNRLADVDIDRGVTELSFDRDKAVLLSMLLGNSFTAALDLVFNLDITGPLSDTTIVPVVKRDTAQLLAKLGLCWRNDTLIKGNLHFIHQERGSPVHVDLANWFCECQEYQTKYFDGMELINVTGNTLVHRLLQELKSKILSPLPICSHLMAILIVKHNSDKFGT